MTADRASIPWRNGIRGPRGRALAALASGVVALHAWVLGALPVGVGERWRGGVQPLQVRSIEVPAPTPQAQDAARSLGAGAAAEPFDDRPPHRMASTADARAAARSARSTAGPLPAATPAPPLDEPGERLTPASARTTGDAGPQRDGAAPAALADAGGLAAPVYPTRIPAPATLRYEMRRGAALGSAVLDWRPGDARYGLSLLGVLGGAEVLGWVSRGGFDDAGLAPERFVVRRRGRDLLAANFQREGSSSVAAPGRVTFSGPSIEWPLQRGMQDRVSWMLQLPAVLEATPALGHAGRQVSMWVVGARGDAEWWTFEAGTPAALDLPAGRVDDAVPFVREPTRPYDSRVEVWLDPARGHLPVRLRFTVRATGEATEFNLQRPESP